MPPLRLAVGIPAYGDSLTAHHARMWAEFGNTLGASAERFGLVMFATVDVNPIDKARNMLLDQAKAHRADWLLMIDADTWVESNTPDEDAGVMLLRMISDADRRDAAIVCAPVVRRRQKPEDPDELMVYVQDSTQPNGRLACRSFEGARHLMPIDYCATACIAINVPRIAGARFRFNIELDLSEDIDFCRQVCPFEKGLTGDPGRIFVDPRVRTGHTSRSFALYSA